jgi:hypothetical protein
VIRSTGLAHGDGLVVAVGATTGVPDATADPLVGGCSDETAETVALDGGVEAGAAA